MASPTTQRQESPRTLQAWIQNATSLLTALIALLAAAGTFFDKAREWVPWLTPEHRPFVFGVAVFSVAITIALQRKRVLRRSEIRVPDALLLHAAGEHFVGREDDTRSLLSLMVNAPLVWLVGESGSGKSTLLQAGAMIGLKSDITKLPMYIDTWGTDWVQGPQQALVDGIRRSWKEIAPAKSALITATNLFEKLAVARQETGRLPILIFDQFDDYQIRHRSHFISPRHSLISPKALSQKNRFWCEIGKLLQGDTIHCLFVTRTDTAASLECVRFLEPEIYHLDRLRKGYALPLLQKLTAGNVIVNPEAGWEHLGRQICSDIEVDGTILPIQMRVVFRSLVGLHPLTTAAYRKQGGLRGLEAANMSYHISETARHAGVDDTVVRQVLLGVIDPESQKTMPATLEALHGMLPESKYTLEKIGQILEDLADKEIVRKRINPDTGASVWLLDHDYLCRGVLELERRASYWEYLLKDAQNNFRAAQGPREIWKALLSPWAQIRLWLERIRGRIRYGDAKRLAQLSLIKLAVNLPVLALAIGLYGVAHFRSQTEVTRLLGEIGSESRNLSDAEADALWRLSRSDYSVKRDLLVAVVSQKGAAERFLRQRDYIVHAIVGFDESTRERLAYDVLPGCSPLSREWTSRQEACESLEITLNPKPSHTAQWISDTLARSTDPAALIHLADGLRTIASKVSESDIHVACYQLLDALKKTTDHGASVRLIDALVSLAARFNESDTHTVSSHFLEAMKKRSGRRYNDALAERLAALPKLSDSDAHAAFFQILETLTTNHGVSNELTRVIAAMAHRVSGPDNQAASSRFMEALRKASETRILNELAEGLSALPKPGDSDLQEAFSLLLERMKGSKPYLVSQLAPGAAAISAKLKQSDTRALSSLLLGAMRKTHDAFNLSELAGGFAAMANVSRGDAQSAFSLLLEALKKPYYYEPHEFTRLAEALEAAAGQLDESDVPGFLGQVGDAIADVRNRPVVREHLGPGFVAVATKLREADAYQVFLGLFERIAMRPLGTSESNTLGKGLSIIAAKLNGTDAHLAAFKLLEAIKKGPNIDVLASSLTVLVTKLAESDAQTATSQLLQAIETSDNAYLWKASASVLRALPSGKLNGTDGHAAFSHVLEASRLKSDLVDSNELLPVLAAIAAKVPGPNTKELKEFWRRIAKLPNPPCEQFRLVATSENIKYIVEVLKWPTCSEASRSQLIEAIGQLNKQSFATTVDPWLRVPDFFAPEPVLFDEWNFADWARREGYNLTTPAQRYPPD